MNLARPEFRWLQVCQAKIDKCSPMDEFAAFTFGVMSGTQHDDNIIKAIANIEDKEYRDHIVAFILSGASLDLISTTLNLHIDVLVPFYKLFMDTSVFCHKMELRRYANYYLKQVCKTEAATKLLKKGLIEGPVGLLTYWNTPDKPLPYTSAAMFRSVVEMTYAKALTARHAGLTDEDTKEGLKWAQTAVKALGVSKIAALDGDVDDQDAVTQIEIIQKDYTYTPEELGLTPGMIIH
jgi:hypothetical protein